MGLGINLLSILYEINMDMSSVIMPIILTSLSLLSVYIIESIYERNAKELIRDFEMNNCN